MADLDSRAFSREPPSVICQNALASAVAHLGAACEFTQSKYANRLTVWSLLRPALMSATTAGWLLLAKEDRERLRRAAIIANESMRYEDKYIDHVGSMTGAQVEERRAWHGERWDALHNWIAAHGFDVKRSRVMKMTSAIEEVATALELDPALAQADWVQMSAAAHGLGWHVKTRTFGRGTTPVGVEGKVAFSKALDPVELVTTLERITGYTALVCDVATSFAGDGGEAAATVR